MLKQLQRYSLFIIIILLTLASLFPLLTAYHYPSFLSDDSYISLTYSKNLINGHGFVFNYSPPVLGTTTPFFTIMVAGLAYILHQADTQSVAVFFTAFCWLGIIWVFFLFRKEWGLKDWQTLVVGLVIIGSGWVNALGMEAYLFTFLLVLCLTFFLSGRNVLTGFFIGLLFITRGEGILVGGVILVTEIIRQYRHKKPIDIAFVKKNLMILLGFALPILAWFFYANITFGAILPNTLAAKQAQFQNGLWLPFWQRLIEQWIPLWGKAFTFETLPILNFWWVIVFIGIVATLIQKQKWLLFACWITFYIFGYIFLNVAGYWWYQLPILFVMNLFFALGVIKLMEITKNRVKPIFLKWLLPVLLGSFLIFILAKQTVDFLSTYSGDPKGESYTGLAQWIRNNTDQSESIAFIEVGYLGYFTDNRIIDLAGLITPDIVPHIAKNDFNWGFWNYHPDYYIYLPDFDWALSGIKMDPRFDLQYKPVATLPGPNEANFVIYKHITQ